MHEKGKTIEDSGGIVMTNDMWLAPQDRRAWTSSCTFYMKYFKAVYGGTLHRPRRAADGGHGVGDVPGFAQLMPKRWRPRRNKLQGTAAHDDHDLRERQERRADESGASSSSRAAAAASAACSPSGSWAAAAARRSSAPKPVTTTHEMLSIGHHGHRRGRRDSRRIQGKEVVDSVRFP